jgi:hypothetical protein
MKYTPEERKLLPEADCDYEVVDARETTSKKKNTPMIEVKLSVNDGKGNRTTIFDNLLPWNLPEFQASIGQKVVFGKETEVEADDLIGNIGRLHLIIENYEGTDRNKVGKYLPAPEKQTLNKDGEPDNIPF